MKATIFIALCIAAVAQAQVQQAIAIISAVPRNVATYNTGNVAGTVIFTWDSVLQKVNVTVDVTGFTDAASNPDAQHGIHIHQYGDLTDLIGNPGDSVGGHWTNATTNPAHGCPENNLTARHLGDMGNWQMTAGAINLQKSLDLLALSGINSIIGRAVVIHLATDDCANVPSSMARLAWGVIGIHNVTGNAAASGPAPAATTGAYDSAICFLKAFAPSTLNGWAYARKAQGNDNLEFWLQLNNLSPVNSTHAVHIHQYGNIIDANGVAGHWNLDNSDHGVPGVSPNYHTGDLGNLNNFSEDGTTGYLFQTLNEKASIYGVNVSLVGHGLVIHAMRDNCTNPVGNAGGRPAVCVWGIINPATIANVTSAVPMGLSATQDAQTLADCAAAYPTTGFAATTVSTTGDNTSSVGLIEITAAVFAAVAMIL